MITLYAVKFSRWHLSTASMVDSMVCFETLDEAAAYVSFCHKHRDEPVDGYTMHLARIESFKVSDDNAKDWLIMAR